MTELFSMIEELDQYYWYFFGLVLFVSFVAYMFPNKTLKTIAIIMITSFIIAEFLIVINFRLFEGSRIILIVVSIVALFFLIGIEENKHTR